MKTKLTKHGNSLAIVIFKQILDLLGWSPDTELEIRTDGKSLTISPPVAGQPVNLLEDVDGE